MAPSERRVWVGLVVVACLGAVLLIIGGVLVPAFNSIISQQVNQLVVPRNGSEPFKDWQNWTRFKPVYRYFYFFDVQNPKDAIRTGKNITVKEIGPYVYRVNFKRRKIAYVDKESRLSYELYKSYTFEPSLSVGFESDNFTTVNLPFMNLATRLRFIRNSTFSTKTSKEIARRNETLLTTVTVSDILWGYDNKNLRDVLNFLYSYFGIRPINDSTYGLMYQPEQPKQTTFEGSFQTSSGIDDVKRLWNVLQWNGNSSLSAWSGHCNDINGTDGYGWPPAFSSSQPLIFDAEWCRSIRLISSKQRQESLNRISTYKYTYDPKSFSYKGDNRGFCHRTPKNVRCLLAGVFNITKCKDNIPLLLSQPHFHDAYYSYRKAINGLITNATRHATTFNLEPLTGELIEASRKLQLNAYVMHVPSFPGTSKFNKNHTVVPIVWMKEDYSMTDKARDSLYRNISLRRYAYTVVQFCFIGIGSLLLFASAVGAVIAWCCMKTPKSSERQPLLRPPRST